MFKPIPPELMPENIEAYLDGKIRGYKSPADRWKPEPESSKAADTNLTLETSVQPESKASVPQKTEPTLVATTALTPGMLVQPKEETPVEQASLQPKTSTISSPPQTQTPQIIAAQPKTTQPRPPQQQVAQTPPAGQWQTNFVVYPGDQPGTMKIIYNTTTTDGNKRNQVWPAGVQGTAKGSIPQTFQNAASFSGQIVRRDAKGKEIIIPFKKGVPLQLKPGDQIQEWIPQPTLAPVETFKDKLKNNALKRLQSNYSRLDADLKEYKNLSPNNPKWQQLRQLANQDQQLVQLDQRLNRQIADLVMKDRKENSFTPPNVFIDRDDVHPLGVVSPQIQAQIKQIESQQALIQVARRQMQAQYPALAVIDYATVANSSNAQLLGQISKEFGKIQFNIKDLSQQIQKDPSKALFLDDVVKGTLEGLKIDPNNPNQSATNQQIIDYLKWEQTKDNLFKWGGTLLTGGFTVGAIIATMASGGTALPFFLGLG
ncbi:MAG: hypothetical protein WCD18_24340, partial [Thermosynechococcaceae cyanobacterium]